MTLLQEYRDAALKLRFSLLRVEPDLQLALPPEQPRLTLGLVLAADNPTSVPFNARELSGALVMDAPEGPVTLSDINLTDGMEIRPNGQSELRAKVSLGFASVRNVWDLLTRSVARKNFEGLRLEGQAKVQAYGRTWTVPLRARLTPRLP